MFMKGILLASLSLHFLSLEVSGFSPSTFHLHETLHVGKQSLNVVKCRSLSSNAGGAISRKKSTLLRVYPLELSQLDQPLTNLLLSSSEVTEIASASSFQPDPLPLSDTTNTVVFLVGIFPFIWATIEFWRRIAVGLPFGTGSDSIIIEPITTIGEDNNPSSSRGRQVLGKGAIVVAYILFAVAAFSVGIAVFSVVTTSPMTSTDLNVS